MKLKQLMMLTFVSVFVITMYSCSKNDENESSGEVKISETGGNESHNAGQNCMNCHKSGGNAEGIFTVAGTVYNNLLTAINPNAVIRLYTLPGGSGTLRGTVYADSKGNFYTTAGIDFSGGLYPSVTGTSGNVVYMASSISQGACNACHGGATARLSVN